VGVLLMIRINAEHRRLMSKRRVPCLDDYLDRVNLLLWPRFKVSGGRGGSRTRHADALRKARGGRSFACPLMRSASMCGSPACFSSPWLPA
jgi:hypothetical protein